MDLQVPKPAVRVFRSHAEAQAADRQANWALTSLQRLEIAEQLRQQVYPGYADWPRLPRVCRVVKRGGR